MANEAETVREVCAEMRGMGNYQSYSGDHARELANRIETAYEREMASKDEEIALLVAAHHHEQNARVGDRVQIAAMKAEIAQLVTDCNRLKAALKPVMDYDFGDYKTPWKTLEVEGELMKGCVRCGDGYPLSIVDDIIFGIDALIEMANAIGEAQRIMKKGEEK